MSQDITFDVIARDKASRTFNSIGSTSKAATRNVSGFGKIAAGVFTGAALYGGVRALARGLVDVSKAAIEDQTSTVLLAKQLKNSANATKGQIAATESWITAQGKAFGVTDNDLRPALARLTTATHNVGKSQRLASLAMNVSAGTGKTLKQVTEALMKAQNGSLTGLSKLGVKTKDATGKTIDFTQAVKDMSKQFAGAAATKAATLQGKMDKLKVAFDETKESIGYALMPILSDLATMVAAKLVPAFDRFAAWLSAHKQDIKDLGQSVGSTVLPPLKALGGIAKELVGFLAGLPGPVKSFGVELAIAAIIVPKFTAGLDSISLRASTMVGNLRNAETRTKMLGGALRNVAGIGGMLALADGAKRANQGLRFLEVTAGGAMAGFAIAGAPGAAIGTVVAALGALATTTHTSAVQMVRAKDHTKDYIDTLNHLTGATTRATRARVLDRLMADDANALLVKTATANGVAMRDIIGAVMGEKGARDRLNATIKTATTRYEDIQKAKGWDAAQTDKAYKANFALAGSLSLLVPQLGREHDAIEKGSKATRDRAAALASWKQALKGVPHEVQTTLKQEGYKPSLAQLRALRRQYDLQPKQIRTVVEATKVPFTVKQVLGLQRVLKDTARTKPDLSPWVRTYINTLDAASRTTYLKTGKIKDTLSTEPGKAKPNFSPFLMALTSSMNTAKAKARVGGAGVGDGLKSGVLIGFAGTGELLALQFATAVRRALAAARKAADINSPSRKTAEIGAFMAEGLIVGLKKKADEIKDAFHGAGVDMVASITDGMDSKQMTLKRVLDKMTDYIQRQSQKVADLMSKRADTIAGFKDFTSSVFTAQPAEGQTNDVSSLLTYQKSELAKATQLKTDVARLLKSGLSRNLVQQLASSGQSGMDQIHALAAGTPAQIAQLNALNAQTQSALTASGTMVGNSLYASDIKDAKQNEAIAKAMAAEFRKVLKEEKDNVVVIVVDENGHRIHTKLLQEKDRIRKGLNLE